MPNTPVYFLGLPRTGKKILSQRLYGARFIERYKKSFGADFNVISSRHPCHNLQLWSGERETLLSVMAKCLNPIICYCIDLSKDINVDDIQKDIAGFNGSIPTARTILVGTKADCCANSEAVFNTLTLHNIQIEQRIITSAKDNTGLEYLKNCFDVLLTASNTVVTPKTNHVAADLTSIYYPYGINRTRYHAFEATLTHCSLKGDYLKRQILKDFEQRITATNSLIQLEELVNTLHASKEYKILRTGQGITTRLFRLQTSSAYALAKMVAEKEQSFAQDNKVHLN